MLKYEIEKREILKAERKRFNVDEFGRCKGGVPRKELGEIRGNAFGEPGSLHNVDYHNFKNTPLPDSQFVTREDALAFKHWQQCISVIKSPRTPSPKRNSGSSARSTESSSSSITSGPPW